MNMPNCLSSGAYQAIPPHLNTSSKEALHKTSRTAYEAIIAAYNDIRITPESEGILTIGVSYDGSWHKGGTLHIHRLGVMIDLCTSLPIDFVVLSTFCIKSQFAPPTSD